MTDAPAGGPIDLVAEFTALPGREHEVAVLLADLTVAVRSEPGCLVFDSYSVTEPPAIAESAAAPRVEGRRFVVIESYRDAGAFADHLAQPHGAAFNAALGPLIAEPDGSVLRFLRPVGRP